MEYCNNCGHECHCGSPCIKEHTDGDGKKIEIECCKQCRCDTPTNKQDFMAKMRLFKFWNEAGDEKEKEALSLKKATMSVQGDFKDKMIAVEYISKKGKQMCHNITIPIGRKIKQAIIQERRREALKARAGRQQKR